MRDSTPARMKIMLERLNVQTLFSQEFPLTGFTSNDENSSAPPRQVLERGLGGEVFSQEEKYYEDCK